MPSTHLEAAYFAFWVELKVAVALSLTSDGSDGSGRQPRLLQLSQSEVQPPSQPVSQIFIV